MKITNPELANYLQTTLKNQYQSFLFAKPEPASIRVNTIKSNLNSLKQQLENWEVPWQPHPVNPNGLIIENDFLPLSHSLPFFKGEFNYQGVASQLPVLALDPQPGETILDMAASPGSKSTQIAALMKNKGRLVLNEVSTRRLRVLIVTTLRSGGINDATMRLSGQRIGTLLPGFFDRVLVDAPCSALGTLPSHLDEISSWWSIKTMNSLANLQYFLLVSAIKATKVNGIIVYSTCSISPEENEIIINKILKEYPVEIEKIPIISGREFQNGLISYNNKQFNPDLKKAIRTYPQKSQMEGFFIVRLRKIAATKIHPTKKTMDFSPVAQANNSNVADVLKHLSKRWGIDLDYLSQFNYLIGKKRIWLINKDWQEIPQLEFNKAGILLAEKKYQEWRLTNSSVQFLKDNITRSILELNKEEIPALFKTGVFEKTDQAPGYYVLKFENELIGSVSLFNGKLKIRLPHSFDLVL
ncbi:RsmB/NOP family class I SAM-dependent RNA methyltransferase [candidate division KSB1 bacterium]|nr:RsmB/NOP family class I SAM-dependent RNA methyltransferase [candidate division KSB1 bacterium]MBL7093245.1 RsmB/NOP family class I SAM-dependent RNA methyltransferase [candidate division KSB1 bacterium]